MSTITSPSNTREGTVQDILDLLQKGESKTIYSTNTDVILVLGTTGSGKSTFTQFIAGYDNDLIAVKTSEFIIRDRNGKIGNDPFTSRTIYPNLVIDTETNAAFYDCPGFSDTRGPAHDIAATYFIKKIIDHAERVKLVFTTDYSSVREDVDRNGFLVLVKNAIDMIKNVKKFNYSIALIVTKVDNNYEEDENGTPILRSDQTVIESIATFLGLLQDHLRSEISKKEFDVFNEHAIQFVDALLHKNQKEYTNIGIFRRPNKVGALSQIKLLQDSKASLKKIIHENIQFKECRGNDFGYTISSDTKNHLHNLIVKINENIVSNIAYIGQEIEKHYNDQEERSSDIRDLYDKFRLGYDSLSATATKTGSGDLIETHQLLEKITKNVNDLNISVSKENFQNINNYGEYLRFIKTLDEESTAVEPVEWAQGLTNIVKYLEDSQKWYNFLINIYDVLSKYHVQRDYRQYSSIVDSFKIQIENNATNEAILFARLKQFLNAVSKAEMTEREYLNIRNVKLNKSKLKILIDLLNLTFKYDVQSLCNGDNLIIKGQYVRLNDVNSANCKKSKFVEIFALNKVFIDTNLNRTGDQVQLSIIAPTLEIIGNPSIVLNGSPGIPIKPEKARNGVTPGSKGDDGKPGEPGGPAGHFFSISRNVASGKYLKLYIIGGKGGPGQVGGDGKEGKDGMIPQIPTSSENPEWGAGFNVKSEINESIQNLPPVYFGGGFVSTDKAKLWDARWWVQGQDCIDGGDGGNGGAGGKGGNSMDPVVINLTENPKFVITASRGETGIGGHGGNGAVEGKQRGQLLILDGKAADTIAYYHEPIAHYTFTVVSREDLKQCFSGQHGVSGKNDKNIAEPKKVVLSHLLSVVANDYKNYVRDHLSNSILESFLRKFLDDLESNKSLEMLYDVFGYVNALQGLEDQFYKLRKELSLLPFYKSLLHRTAQYANKLYENKELADDNKKVLGYVYTTTLSKIYSINNDAGNYLVMDLPLYLDETIEEINRLKDLGSITSINEEQTKYQKLISQKIDEAQEFVESQINPEMNNIFEKIDRQIELLIDEVVALQNAVVQEKTKLVEQQHKLENALTLKTLLSIPKIASQFLSFLGPVGAAAGAAIGGGLTLIESLVLDPSSVAGSETFAALPAAIKNTASKVTKQLKDKQLLFKEQLADAQLELRNFLKDQPASKHINDIDQKVTTIRTNLEREIAKGQTLDPAFLDNIYKMRTDVADLLRKKKKLLKDLKPETNAKIYKQLRIVNQVQNIVGVMQISLKFYRQIKKDQAKLSEVSLAIKKADEKLTELMLYEQSIYKNILLICKNLENKVNEMESNLQGKSHAALDISKWKIQSTLRDVKLEMQKLTKGFKVQEDITRCLEKLEEGMSIMINMYDRIEDYHDKAELADYIANINSNRANEIQISNEVLRREVDDLKWIIQSNLVLEKYEMSMKAFMQHIYPFADYFIAEFDLPTSLKSNDTGSLVAISARKISILKSKLIESEITINKYDEYIHSKVSFNSKGNRSSPFFVWNNNEHKNAIRKLLEGAEITVKSDIKRGLNKNAIKFNTIGIYFKLANQAMQNELNEHLKNFELEMTHMGTSYYRCENKFHTIASEVLPIVQTFARDTNGYPIDSNDVYKKLKMHEPVLSPFTLWKIQLKYSIGKNYTFASLEKYKDKKIDLELHGTGQYVDRGVDVCNDNLNKYYVVDNTISEIDNIDSSNQQLSQKIPMIESFSAKKKRRSVDEHESAQEINTNAFATSGACSSMKSSFLNNVFNLLGTGLAAYDYMNPLNKIGQWFTKNEGKIGNEDFMGLDDRTYKTMQSKNIQSLDPELSTVSDMFINDESSTVSGLQNDVMFCNNGNLLLLDLIIRQKNGIKYKHKHFPVDQKRDVEYAQNLAFNAYAFKICNY